MTAADRIATDHLRFERLLDAPIHDVWQHLVDSELRALWFMGGSADLRAGGKIELIMNHDRLSDADVLMPDRYRPFVGHSWEERILRVEPPHQLAFTWEDGKAGEVTFELEQADVKTRMVLTHTGLRGREDAIDFGGGWHSHLAVLERRLRNEAVPDYWALHAEAEAQMQKALPRT